MLDNIPIHRDGRYFLRIPGHGREKHERCSVPFPGQSYPPWAGAGLSHCLVLDSTPKPHVVLHTDQSCQSPQLPSTIEKYESKNRVYSNLDMQKTGCVTA